jgi:hypothetical protein
LFKLPIQKKSRDDYTQFKTSIKQDFLKVHQHNLNIGDLGELFAIIKEKERLLRNGLTSCINKLVHCSKENDTLGYDIISFSDENTKRYIEVKTTTDSFATPFFLSQSEIKAMQQLNNYFIYRIFDFDVDTRVGKFFILNCQKDFQKYFTIEPVSYKISPK